MFTYHIILNNIHKNTKNICISSVYVNVYACENICHQRECNAKIINYVCTKIPHETCRYVCTFVIGARVLCCLLLPASRYVMAITHVNNFAFARRESLN